MKIQKRSILQIVLVLAAVLAMGGCQRSSSESGIVQRRMGTGTKPEEKQEQEAILEDSTEVEAMDTSLYMILNIDTEQKLASFQKVSSGRQFQYAYHTGTQFLDKYGSTKSVQSFYPGDVARIEVSGKTQKLERVQLSDEVWVQEDIVNYSLDEESGAFTIGQTKYICDPMMEIFSGEGTIGFGGIGESDVLRAVGMDKKLISLAVTKGHGYLALSNTELFEGSFICVGSSIFAEVTKNMQMQVPEGDYLVTVANDGYGGSREIHIGRDETTSLNLDELKGEGPKLCKITFDVGVEGATLWIDDKKADYTKPVEVRYGIHTIAVEAEGYETITEKLVVNSPQAEIEIALTQSSGSKSSETEKDKGSEKKDSSQSGSGTTGNNGSGTGNNTNGNTNNNQNNNSGNNANNNGGSGGNNTNANGNTNSNSSQSDYLTTLYNLLTSINNNGNNNNNSNNNNNNNNDGSRSYDDLRDE